MNKFVKKITAITLVITMLLSNALVIRADEPLQVFPLRQVFEEKGVGVYWDDAARSISLVWRNFDITVTLTVDSTAVYVNDQSAELERGPFLVNATTFVTAHDLDLLLQLIQNYEPEMPHMATTMATTAGVVGQLMEVFSVPGVTVAIVDVNNDFVWTQGFGYANTATRTPVSENTLFNLASISKPFTAIAVMQLVEAGLVDLDNPVITYLPDFTVPPSLAGYGDYSNITVRMLLSHASGLQGDFMGYRVFTTGEYYQGFVNNLLERLATTQMALPEGVMFSYGNNNYNLLGMLVAAVSGYDNFFEGYVSYMQENVLAPLGMDMSTFALTDTHMPYVARPYEDADTLDTFVFYNAIATAGLYSNAQEMARFMQMVLGGGELDGQRILETVTLEKMFVRADFNFESELKHMMPNTHPGLGFIHFEGMDGFTFTGHNGTLVHYHSHMGFDRDAGIGVFISVNSISGMAVPEILMPIILQTAVMEATGTLNIPESDLTVQLIDIPEEELLELEGLFMFLGGSDLVRVAVVDGFLTMYNALDMPEMSLLPLSDGSFVVPDMGIRFWFCTIDGERVIYMGEFRSLLIGLELDASQLTTPEEIAPWVGIYYPVVTGNEASIVLYVIVEVDENGVGVMRMHTWHQMQTISPLSTISENNFGGVEFRMEDGEAWMSLLGLQLRRAE